LFEHLQPTTIDIINLTAANVVSIICAASSLAMHVQSTPTCSTIYDANDGKAIRNLQKFAAAALLQERPHPLVGPPTVDLWELHAVITTPGNFPS
jgi:hypothetical protein